MSEPPGAAVVCKCEKIEEFVSLSFSMGLRRFLVTERSPSLLMMEVRPLNLSAKLPFFECTGVCS